MFCDWVKLFAPGFASAAPRGPQSLRHWGALKKPNGAICTVLLGLLLGRRMKRAVSSKDFTGLFWKFFFEGFLHTHLLQKVGRGRTMQKPHEDSSMGRCCLHLPLQQGSSESDLEPHKLSRYYSEYQRTNQSNQPNPTKPTKLYRQQTNKITHSLAS